MVHLPSKSDKEQIFSDAVLRQRGFTLGSELKIVGG